MAPFPFVSNSSTKPSCLSVADGRDGCGDVGEEPVGEGGEGCGPVPPYPRTGRRSGQWCWVECAVLVRTQISGSRMIR